LANNISFDTVELLGTGQKPLGYTAVALMYHIVVHLPCLLPEFSLNSDAPGVLFIMRGAVTEGCRPHSGLQPTIIVLQRYLFLRKFYVVYPSGPYVPHRTNLYGVVIKILALIFFAACHQTSFFFHAMLTQCCQFWWWQWWWPTNLSIFWSAGITNTLAVQEG